MPRRLNALRLWAIVFALGLSGIAALSLAAESRPPEPLRAWSHLGAI